MISREQGGFLLLAVLAVMLIIIGIQGSLGVLFAIVFCPAYVETNEGGGGSFSDEGGPWGNDPNATF